MRLGIRHIASYLPYGIHAYDERQERKTDEIIGLYRDTIESYFWSPIDAKMI